MSFSDLSAGIDVATQVHLCDLFELRPVGGGVAIVVSAMVDEPVQSPGFDLRAPVQQATIQVLAADRVLKVGDVAMPGVRVDGVFVPAALGWRVAGAPTREVDGRWQTAAVERFRPS